jgi:hypothetical protein
MSVAVILAARPVQIEGFLGGLDKFYRLNCSTCVEPGIEGAGMAAGGAGTALGPLAGLPYDPSRG